MNFYERIYEVVKSIPEGRVMSYGQVGAVLGNVHFAQTVGNALHVNPSPADIPCHRVVRSDGSVSEGYAFGGAAAQRKRLEDEGVCFKSNGKVDMKRYSAL